MSSAARPGIRNDAQRCERGRVIVARIDAAVLAIAARWTSALFGFVAGLFALAAIAPVLRERGHDASADSIFFIFRAMCHQDPDRTFHILGHPMACCQRDLAIFGSAAIAIMYYTIVRRRRTLAPLPLVLVLALTMPMVFDGATQLAGMRESIWQLRLVTGGLFAGGVCGLVLPSLDRGFGRIIDDARVDIQ